MNDSYTGVARSFAQAMADRNYERATSFLSPALTSEFNALALAQEMKEMLAYVDDDGVTQVKVMSTLEDWPAKQAGDIGWAYVAMSGASFSEGVAVIVSDIGSKLLIRKIEWGRP